MTASPDPSGLVTHGSDGSGEPFSHVGCGSAVPCLYTPTIGRI